MADPRSRLLRGGAWSYEPRYCRAAYRGSTLPGLHGDLVGFRVVCPEQGDGHATALEETHG